MDKLELTEEQWAQVHAGNRLVVPTPEQAESIRRLTEAEENCETSNRELAQQTVLAPLLRRVQSLERELAALRSEMSALRTQTHSGKH